MARLGRGQPIQPFRRRVALAPPAGGSFTGSSTIVETFTATSSGTVGEQQGGASSGRHPLLPSGPVAKSVSCDSLGFGRRGRL